MNVQAMIDNLRADEAEARPQMHFIYLSRRNLLTLLSKLDRRAEGEDTACAIIKYRQTGTDIPFNQTMQACVVVGVPDEEFYSGQNRPAGPMHPADDPKNKD